MKILLIGGCGYVGSALYPALEASGHSVDSIDLERRGNPAGIPNRRTDCGALTAADLEPYDCVVLLAAHASVAEVAADPQAAFDNNVVAFHRLLTGLRGRRLIYASSSSVYTGMGGVAATEGSPWFALGNLYDFSKFIGDGLATLSGEACFGLRFGTVNGPSPNIRNDLMLNSMVLSALSKGEVRVRNIHVHRPILAVKDLTRALCAMVDGDGPPGVYNLASFNTTVLEAGNAVGQALDVPVEIDPDTPSYDFSIDTTKFAYRYGLEPEQTLESVIRDLIGHYTQTTRAGASSG